MRSTIRSIGVGERRSRAAACRCAANSSSRSSGHGTRASRMPTWFASAAFAKNPKYVVPSYTSRRGVADVHVVVLDDHPGGLRHVRHRHGRGQRAAVRRDRPELRRLARRGCGSSGRRVTRQRRPAVRGEPPARLEGDLQQDAERHVRARGWRRSTTRRGGTSYSASQLAPAFSTNGSPVTAVTQSRNWYGGPGSRAMTRSRVEDPVRLAERLRRLAVGVREDLGGVVEGSETRPRPLPEGRGVTGVAPRLHRASTLRPPPFREGAGGRSARAQIASNFSRVSPVIRSVMFVISTIGLPSAYISASATQNGSGR